MIILRSIIVLTLTPLLLLACSQEDISEQKDASTKTTRATRVTVTQVQSTPLENTEETIGYIEGLIDPTLAAEVAARVVKVYVSPGDQVKKGQLVATLDASDFTMQRNEAVAEVKRIEALLENQQKIVARNQALVDKNFISQNALDNEMAQQNVLKQQLEAAKARVASINHSGSKSTLYAPVSGTIEKKLVDTGDYVRVGDPILQIVSNQRLRAHLPFPEHIGALLRPGLKVRLTTPASDKTIETTLSELKPLIAEGNRTIDAIADIAYQPGWKPGASTTGTVILGEQPTALMIPEQSVVLRPAGETVYLVRGDRAHQALVKTGLRQKGMIQILTGLQAKDTIVVDGAGFLTDNARILINQESTP